MEIKEKKIEDLNKNYSPNKKIEENEPVIINASIEDLSRHCVFFEIFLEMEVVKNILFFIFFLRM